MSAIEKSIAQANEHIKKLEEQKRFDLRIMRKMEKKKEQRRNYVVGEMFVEYFDEMLRLEPGTKAENVVVFQPFKEFLEELSADEKWRNRLKEKLSRYAVSSECKKTQKGG